MFYILNKDEIEKMRSAGKLAAETLQYVSEIICEGMTTVDLDRLIQEHTEKVPSATCAPYLYRGSRGNIKPFPSHACYSINEVACHGIAENRKLQNGDIINVDITTKYQNCFGDTSRTFRIGNVSEEAERICRVTEEAMFKGIELIKEGCRVGDIGAVVEDHAIANGFQVLKDFVGHSIGPGFFHGPLMVPFYNLKGLGQRLKAGMCITVEPILTNGPVDHLTNQENEWVVTLTDKNGDPVENALSAQFEHTILVLADGFEILTKV